MWHKMTNVRTYTGCQKFSPSISRAFTHSGISLPFMQKSCCNIAGTLHSKYVWDQPMGIRLYKAAMLIIPLSPANTICTSMRDSLLVNVNNNAHDCVSLREGHAICAAVILNSFAETLLWPSLVNMYVARRLMFSFDLVCLLGQDFLSHSQQFQGSWGHIVDG